MNKSNIIRITDEVAEKMDACIEIIQNNMNLRIKYISLLESAIDLYYKKLMKDFNVLTEQEEREVIEEMQNTYPPTEEYFNPDFQPLRRHYEEYVEGVKNNE